MFVRDRMSAPAITVPPDAECQDALQLMQDHECRRLPVLDEKGGLVGIVLKADLPCASLSPAAPLSTFEQHYLLRHLQVSEVMSGSVITTTPDTPVEDAARLMVDHKVGGLPVADERSRIVGVITETDVFEAFVEMFAGGRHGLRLTLEIPKRKDVLLELCTAIFDQGGSVLSVGSYDGPVSGENGLVVKVQGASEEHLVNTLEALGDHVVDVRQV